MQALYDPQDILKILRSPEKTESASVFVRLKNLVLAPFHYLKQLESWFYMKTTDFLKTTDKKG